MIEAYNAPGRALEKPEQIRDRMLLENFCVNGTADVTFPGATEAELPARCRNSSATPPNAHCWSPRTRPDSTTGFAAERATVRLSHVSVLVGDEEHDDCGA